ncbi:hypothetical protein HHK36_011574 [Tetracentron sinense]|uniref:Mediator of RNA polymerase II transcription subunit 27 n=1 Tax=Tetracentron sinense TaxID=13715 RepID=A0A834ZD82_TETSI|nr:hypothetical protein HHK36_011574 [Tetracentron sinense]
MQQQAQAPVAGTPQPEPPESGESPGEAPPKQVALAMDRLGHAARLIADIRIGADRLLEALFIAAQPHQSNKPMNLILKEEASMRQHLQDLRTVVNVNILKCKSFSLLGRQLEDSGVLNGSLRSRSNSWGLHMPLVCPDGAVVAYAWKRQLAGQAGASAVDRTRLALKAFTDQKRRFFPHLEDRSFGQTSGGESIVSKKHCVSQVSTLSYKEELIEDRTLSSVLMRLEKEEPSMEIFTYQRLDWLKRASSMSSSANENSIQSSKEYNIHTSNKRTESLDAAAANQVSVVELLVPSVFRAIVSLHPAGSVDPDAVAFFSPDEVIILLRRCYFHLILNTCISQNNFAPLEHAVVALQYFLGLKTDTALYLLLNWICSYQTLFTKVCRQSALLLPPVHRPYQHSSATKISSTQSTFGTKDQSLDVTMAYHIGCSSDEA